MNVEKYQSYIESLTLKELTEDRATLFARLENKHHPKTVLSPNFFTYATQLHSQADTATMIGMINQCIQEGNYTRDKLEQKRDLFTG